MKLSAIRDTNDTPVDWWFMYKLPEGAKAPQGARDKSKQGKPSSGSEYIYFDADAQGAPGLSPNTIEKTTSPHTSAIGWKNRLK